MNTFEMTKIFSSDKTAMKEVEHLLTAEGIQMDKNLDYTCAAVDEQKKITATGSCFGNTLRCLAVHSDYQGYGLLNQVVSHLVDYQFSRGKTHLFLYTKSSTAKFFKDLGFFEIVHVKDKIAFLENKPRGFSNYLEALSKQKREGQRIASVVMNANPFTLGHLHLLEKASLENDWVHLFIVSEDASLFPFHVRKQLVIEGSKHLNNIVYHDSGPYMISRDTFPSYFQKDEAEVIETQALVDLAIFTAIAKTLQIDRRYVGEEPTSFVTHLYNETMKEALPKAGIDCIVIPRIGYGEGAISASTVRTAIKENKADTLRHLLPASTLNFLKSEAAKPIVDKIKNTKEVVHY